ncbi:MAG TPA: glycosyltransferase family 4 protein, partial [Thermaerobacter sp.]
STHMALLRKGLEAHGHSVRIRSFNDFSPAEKLLTRGPSWVLNHVRRGWGALWTAGMRIRGLTRILRAEADWVHVLNVEDPMAAAAARHAGLPYVYTAHGYPTDEHIAAGRIRSGTGAYRRLLDLERQGLREAVHVVTVDSRIRHHVLSLAGHDRVTVIPNFVDTSWPAELPDRAAARDALGIPEGAFVILCPRRLTAKNGVLYAVEALALLVRESSAVGVGRGTVEAGGGGGRLVRPAAPGESLPGRPLLLIVGSGEQLPEVRALIRRRGLEPFCRLEGGRPHEEMGLYLKAADVVVIPSVHVAGVEEATSISALEAMAFGVPVVASAVGGLREIIRDGETGLLVPQRRPEALARAIRAVAGDPILAGRLVEAGHRYVLRHHSHLEAARRFLEIYETCRRLSRAGQGGGQNA